MYKLIKIQLYVKNMDKKPHIYVVPLCANKMCMYDEMEAKKIR